MQPDSEAYFVFRDGEQQGPFSYDQMRGLYLDGAITDETLIFQQGMAEWKPLSVVLPQLPRINNSQLVQPQTVLSSTQAPAANLPSAKPRQVLVALVAVCFVFAALGIGGVVWGLRQRNQSPQARQQQPAPMASANRTSVTPVGQVATTRNTPSASDRNQFLETKAKAERGEPAAQFELGEMYAEGKGVAKDKAEAVKWYRRAAEQNDSYAQCMLGLCYCYGEGIAKDYIEAAKWYRKAAEQGHAAAQFELGEMYYYGNGVTKDEAEALTWYRKAAEQNVAAAQFNLGFYYYIGRVVERNYEEAVKWFRKAADQNYGESQLYLGVCYNDGLGVKKDSAEAVKWYRRAAEQNFGEAKFALGNYYYTVAKDYVEAAKWYRMIAEQNDAPAQYKLGLMYAYGKGVLKNSEEAVKWYRKSAEQGYLDAQYQLGVCYYTGIGTVQDDAEAVKWFRKAADGLSLEAQFQLGFMYAYGKGVPKNPEEGIRLIRRAASFGNKEALQYLEDRNMTIDGAPATVQPAQPQQSVVVVNASSKVTESNSVFWRYAWQLTLRNNERTPARVNATVKFLDKEGFVVESENAYGLTLGPLETKTFTGATLVNTGPARTVTRVTAEAKLRAY